VDVAVERIKAPDRAELIEADIAAMLEMVLLNCVETVAALAEAVLKPFEFDASTVLPEVL
jgi:hypothetical protein